MTYKRRVTFLPAINQKTFWSLWFVTVFERVHSLFHGIRSLKILATSWTVLPVWWTTAKLHWGTLPDGKCNYHDRRHFDHDDDYRDDHHFGQGFFLGFFLLTNCSYNTSREGSQMKDLWSFHLFMQYDFQSVCCESTCINRPEWLVR